MSIQSMGGILEQIQFQAQQISATGNTNPLKSTQSNSDSVLFSSLLFDSINNINDVRSTARTQAQDYIKGTSDIGLNDVMVSMQKSSIALNLGIQVRNKMVSAYQEIMNMAV
ncbi:flagellar hook-basal body complex protein FliE [Obesumbacterium proteus]|uniref:flagellar hook-basal body complex protein FliE n=1 Tax=Obesumbacterium proteus TaxID=82983 RepID=UPI0010340DD5|nr:flagellar hook-basal body complex protein FliE [Obesumbacterium proteus]TBL74236.1 flagellar hook-basal body complex protein FliE [Obesumbacterium proteus]